MPFRLKVFAECVRSLDVLREQAASCEGLRRLQNQPAHDRKLSIVGGGPSVLDHLGELTGDVWGVNDAASWLISRGVEATLFTVDPVGPEKFRTHGVKRAILATLCHPKLRERFEHVDLFDMIETDPQGVSGGTTSANRAATLAIRLGYRDVTWYGCESSWDGEHHVYQSDDPISALIVRAGGKDYITKLEFMTQAESLAELIRLAPTVFKERSGGLLRAMIEHHETWEVVAVSESLKAEIQAISGNLGFYDHPYEGINHGG